MPSYQLPFLHEMQKRMITHTHKSKARYVQSVGSEVRKRSDILAWNYLFVEKLLVTTISEAATDAFASIHVRKLKSRTAGLLHIIII